MAYEYITRYDSPNYGHSGKRGNAGRAGGKKPSFIVVHHWGIDGQKFETPLNWLCRKGGDSSAHYIVEAGKVACIVAPNNQAWHAGSKGNPGGIGIECRPECTPADRETVAELIAELRAFYGNLPLYPHKKFSATTCPGRWENYLGWLSTRANEILKGKKASSTPAPSTEQAYRVRVTVKNLNIRSGPGTNTKVKGTCPPGVYTITATASGQGSRKGWGKLKSGAGWIALDYAPHI